MTTTTNYYLKYKRELMVMILEGENERELISILQRMNLHADKIYSLEEIIKNTNENFLLHYQGGRRIAVKKDSLLGRILLSKVK